MHSVIGRDPLCKPGFVSGFARRALKKEVYPAMITRDGEMVKGMIYFDLTSIDIARLDYFEGEMYERKLVEVSSDEKLLPCYTYLLKENYFHLLSEESWDFDNFMVENSARFTRDFRGWTDLEN